MAESSMRGGFDQMVGSTDPAMVVVTAATDGRIDGCLVGFHSQSSIEPALCCLWLSRANLTYELALESAFLAVHFLATDDGEIARLFGGSTGDEIDKFASCDHEVGPHGLPLISACRNRLIVHRLETLDGSGDHVGFVCEPVEVEASGKFEPLRLSQVGDLAPGHEAAERRSGQPGTGRPSPQ